MSTAVMDIIRGTRAAWRNKIPVKQWSRGRGEYIPHVEAIDRWINKYSSDKGIFVCSKHLVEYPEVTGYWIETLIEWGYMDKARSWFEWLISIQNDDGGWPDPYNNPGPSVFFDSGQVMRGVMCYANIHNIDVSDTALRFLDYYASAMSAHVVPKKMTSKDISWSAIRLQVVWIVNKYWPEMASRQWLESALEQAFEQWDVGYQVSHFDIYILEALYELDLFVDKLDGYIGYFEQAVDRLGVVPVTRHNDAPCYTATAQFGVLLCKMGRFADARKLSMSMLGHLDTRRGNWPGSGPGGGYFTGSEISWGLKYFLDLLYSCQENSFDIETNSWWSSIDGQLTNDIAGYVKNCVSESSSVLEVGCGLGRYLNELSDYEGCRVFGIDISVRNVQHCQNIGLDVVQTSMTRLDLPPKFPERFDLIYLVESFEHAVIPANVLSRLRSHLKDAGQIIIIDKDPNKCFYYQLAPFERYYTEKEYRRLAKESDLRVKSYKKLGIFNVCEMTIERNSDE